MLASAVYWSSQQTPHPSFQPWRTRGAAAVQLCLPLEAVRGLQKLGAHLETILTALQPQE